MLHLRMNYCTLISNLSPYEFGVKYKFRYESYKKGPIKIRVYYNDLNFKRFSVEDFDKHFKGVS